MTMMKIMIITMMKIMRMAKMKIMRIAMIKMMRMAMMKIVIITMIKNHDDDIEDLLYNIMKLQFILFSYRHLTKKNVILA